MSDPVQQANEIIDEYIRRNATLEEMNRIAQQHTGKSIEFTRWDEAHEFYSDFDWDKETLNEFTYLAKEVVESGVSTISESYLFIPDEERISLREIEKKLQNYEDKGDDIDLDFEMGEEGYIECRLIYRVYSVDITAYGDVQRLVEENAVSFEIRPSSGLIIVHSTSPANVRKVQGELNNMSIRTTASTLNSPDETNDAIDDFLDSFVERNEFVHGNSPTGSPILYEITEIKMRNPEPDANLESIQFSGNEIDTYNEIEEYRLNGWTIQSFSAKIYYNDLIYDVTVSIGKTMSYMKIEGVGDFQKGSELAEEIRDRFMNFFVVQA